MKCQYPNCNVIATLKPIIRIPTIRTVGIPEPELTPLALDEAFMLRMGLSRNMAIAQYEARVKEYKEQANTMVECGDPTLLEGPPLCVVHVASYNFFDWFKRSDWDVLVEAAAAHGVLLDTGEVKVEFETVDWTPGAKYLEME